MRGTGAAGLRLFQPLRFIPARAGNRYNQLCQRETLPVHPRSCGEQTIAQKPGQKGFGSSPLVRGTEFDQTGNMTRIRFIPARAGNRKPGESTVKLSSVHPRSCGEQIRERDRPARVSGSSPLVRGTGSWNTGLGLQARFIPARAGNRAMVISVPRASSVHPRSCGEQ